MSDPTAPVLNTDTTFTIASTNVAINMLESYLTYYLYFPNNTTPPT